MDLPEKGYYYHFKHDPHGPVNHHAYRIIGVAFNTEDESYMVIYKPLYENDFLGSAEYCVRPLAMFMETVTREGKTFSRFQKITDPSIIAVLEKL